MVYRAYSRRPDGRLHARYGFAAPDDDAALAHARRFLSGGVCEVWQAARHVGTLAAEDDAGGPAGALVCELAA